MKNILRIISLFLLPIVIDGMKCCDCPDSEKAEASFSYCNLEVSYLDNTGEEPVLTYSLVLPKDAMGIRINVERKKDICEFQKSWFGTSAYACSCGYDTIYSPLEEIVSAQIITVNDFDAQHTAGSDITEYFYSYKSHQYKSALNEFRKDLQEVNYYTGNLLKEISFLLMTAPAPMTECIFKIRVELSDGRVLEDTTEQIVLQ